MLERNRDIMGCKQTPQKLPQIRPLLSPTARPPAPPLRARRIPNQSTGPSCRGFGGQSMAGAETPYRDNKRVRSLASVRATPSARPPPSVCVQPY